MRVLWILLMIGGVILFGGLALDLALSLFSGAEGPLSIRRATVPLLLLMVAGACGAGIFMKPREFKAAMTPDEEEVPTADWIKEMRREQNPADKP